MKPYGFLKLFTSNSHQVKGVLNYFIIHWLVHIPALHLLVLQFLSSYRMQIEYYLYMQNHKIVCVIRSCNLVFAKMWKKGYTSETNFFSILLRVRIVWKNCLKTAKKTCKRLLSAIFRKGFHTGYSIWKIICAFTVFLLRYFNKRCNFFCISNFPKQCFLRLKFKNQLIKLYFLFYLY